MKLGIHLDRRRKAMAKLYRAGKTLQEIGDKYGVSRERVRQLISREGLRREGGGAFIRSLPKRIDAAREAARRRDDKCMRARGCLYEEAIRLNGGQLLTAPGCKAKKYYFQKKTAAGRGIEWAISFPEWCEIWDGSGKWDLRGRGDGFCMARLMDTGAYSPENVYITSSNSNVVDYQASLKERGVMCADGYRRLPENRYFESNQPGRQDRRRNNERDIEILWMSSEGMTATEVGLHFGISENTVYWIRAEAKRNPQFIKSDEGAETND